ncbi:MAG: hypothetical protein J6V72_11130 [Kiritimatiellae bacterium]|nr:hypothetical protein [Kiritimatiellia bacterium]
MSRQGKHKEGKTLLGAYVSPEFKALVSQKESGRRRSSAPMWLPPGLMACGS